MEEDLFFEMPVVLSASRLEQPISETPMAVTSIDRQVIEASGARTIPEILRLVPGIVVGHSADEWGHESKIVVAYHGHTEQYSKQMQVLIDGRSIYEPLLGGVNWNMLPINIEDIERIEVTRGPNSSTYGSNSFLAVVNIITRHASEDPGHLAKLKLGNHDIRDALYRYGGNNEDGDIDYRVTLSTQNDDGQDARKNVSTYSPDVYMYSDEEVENYDDIHSGAIDYRIDFQVDNQKQLTYQGGYTKTLLEINENFEGSQNRSESDTENLNQFIKLENTPNSKNTFIIQYYYNQQHKNDQSLSKDVFGTNLFVDRGIKSERHNIEFTHYNQTTNDLRLIWGISAQKDIAQSPHWLTFQGTVSRETYRLFASTEWQITADNLLNFGALIEENKELDTEVSPRLSLIHKLNEKHSVRIGVSRAIRSPFIVEQYGNTIFTLAIPPVTYFDQQLAPNEDLKNETIVSREIGYLGQFVNDTLLFNIRLFQDDLNNLIHTLKVDDVNPDPGIYTPAPDPNLVKTDKNFNTTSSEIQGIELEFDYQANKSLRLLGSASHIKIEANGEFAEEYERSAPRKAASLMAIKKFNENYSSSLGFYYASPLHFLDAPGPSLDSQKTMDIKISKSSRNAGRSSKLSLILKNLLGEYSDYNGRPRYGPINVQTLTGYIEYEILFK